MILDARDLFSPKPTVMALEALTELALGETLAVSVNSGKPVDDLMHLAKEHHCDFSIEDEGDYVVCTFSPTERIVVERPPLEEALRLMGIEPMEAPTILFGSDSIGKGNDLVGQILVNEFLIDLSLQEDLPSAVIFYNSGAKLTQKVARARSASATSSTPISSSPCSPASREPSPCKPEDTRLHT